MSTDKQAYYDDFIDYINNAYNFNTHNGYRIVELREGFCAAEVTLTRAGLNPQGVAHGSLVYGLCDLSAGMAAATTGKNLLTLNAGIHYLRPGTGARLRTEASIIKDGRKTSLVEVKVFDDENRLCATGEFTIFYTGGTIDLDERRRRDAKAEAAEKAAADLK